jgi:hypothetical protein
MKNWFATEGSPSPLGFTTRAVIVATASAKEKHQDDNQKDQAGVGPRARKNQRLTASVAAR